MKKKTKIFCTIIGIAVIIGLITLFLYLKSVKDYKDEVAAITIDNVDLSRIPDGTYDGDCNVDFVYAKVEVTVKDGVITNINLVKQKCGKGRSAKSVINDIIAKQKIKVDTVSGATNSSKVIMKAIEKALTNIEG